MRRFPVFSAAEEISDIRGPKVTLMSLYIVDSFIVADRINDRQVKAFSFEDGTLVNWH